MGRQPLPSDEPHKRWSRAVRNRDGKICQRCGVTNARMNAHHLIPWRERPDLVFDVSNGLTLCPKCHVAIHVERGDYDHRMRRETRFCAVCSKPFVKRLSELERCCSLACGAVLSGQTHTKRVVVICERCGAEVIRRPSQVGKRVFCSTACRRQIEPRTCPICTTMFKPKAQQVQRGQGIYCSKACMGIAWRGTSNPNYRHGQRVSSAILA